MERVRGLAACLWIARDRPAIGLGGEVIARVAAVVVADLADELPEGVVPLELVREPKPLLTPLIEVCLVPGRLLRQREGPILNRRKTSVGRDPDLSSFAGDRADAVVRKPSAAGKVVEAVARPADGAVRRADPEVALEARRQTGGIFEGQALRSGYRLKVHAAQFTQTAGGGDPEGTPGAQQIRCPRRRHASPVVGVVGGGAVAVEPAESPAVEIGDAAFAVEPEVRLMGFEIVDGEWSGVGRGRFETRITNTKHSVPNRGHPAAAVGCHVADRFG